MGELSGTILRDKEVSVGIARLYIYMYVFIYMSTSQPTAKLSLCMSMYIDIYVCIHIYIEREICTASQNIISPEIIRG
jgi:hypothetical protein